MNLWDKITGNTPEATRARRAKDVRKSARAGQAWEDRGRLAERLRARSADRNPRNSRGWGR
ncbi:hypothetical protein P3T37_001307 [Kitasatospora sp. MAA4]|uniref:hypothetical protein n=1 Tax=Kitasatospora sp. MAA4 TaxID=3035093 RepID=UPI0024743439|nr:hypothetical protein [Kitasatospora sp. MAA4]MDH6131933.1 hypothetical protein [Kitasatospora sp. MAA4]